MAASPSPTERYCCVPVADELERRPAAETEELIAKYDVGARVRHYSGPAALIVTVLAAAMSLFHLYANSLFTYHAMVLRSVHLAFVLTLIFLLYPFRYKPGAGPRAWVPWVDVALALGGVAVGLYVIVNLQEIMVRAGAYTTADMAFGILGIILILEAGRRATGWLLPILSLIFLLYPLFGSYLPGIFTVRPYPLERLVTYMYLTTEGYLGLATGVSATYVFLFVLFGAFLNRTGTGRLFIDLALAAMGRSVGGPAKVAVVSSGLMGTINGSAIANVAGTGVFTIPLMKRTGYSPHFAGAVEAAASTGGQLMPPVMGAAAFIMAEFIGVPYMTIALAAALPAVLYFFSVLVMVHLEALKEGLKPAAAEEVPRIWPLLKERGLLLVPIPAVLYFLFQGYTPTFAAVAGIVSSILVSNLRKETRMTPRGYLDALVGGARDVLPVAIACVMIGFIIGTTSLTGIGLKIAGAIVALGQGNLFATLVVAMIANIVLGTGLPTTATYIVTATMVGPALLNLGVDLLPGHLFVFYYGIIADLTPPIALAALVGAGIARADPDRTAWTSWRLSLAGTLIPFMFVYSPAMLLVNTPLGDAVRIVATSIVGVLALATGVQGYWSTNLRLWERALLLLAAVLLIDPQPLTDLAGALAMGGVYLWQKRRAPAGAWPIIGRAVAPQREGGAQLSADETPPKRGWDRDTP